MLDHKFSAFLTALCLLVQATWGQSTSFSVSTEEADQLHEELTQLKNFFEPVLEELPTSSFEAEALAMELPPEAEGIVGWFRENVHWVPYRGRLRGPNGVLMDRRGNSLDQAMLLGTLLETAGHEVRLARQSLTPGEASVIAENILGQDSQPTQKALSGYDAEVIASLANRVGMRPEELEVRLADLEHLAGEHADRVRGIVEEQADFLSASIRRAAPYRTPLEEAIEALTDHWWVQYKDRHEWTDADTVIPVSSNGSSLVSRAPKEFHLLGDLPEELSHRITLRVVAERWHKDSVDEQVALELSFVPEEHVERPIQLRWIPVQSPPKTAPIELSDSERLRFTATEEREWLPVFTFGQEMKMQSSIYTDGKINRNPNLTENTKKVSQAIGALGGLTPSPDSASELTAVWLDYSIKAPGAQEREVRRVIFDLLGEDKRKMSTVPKIVNQDAKDLERGLALLGHTTILASVSWLQKPYVERLLVQDFLDNAEQISYMAQLIAANIDTVDDPALRQLEGLNPLPADLYSYQLLRSTIDQGRKGVFLGQANIVNQHSYGVEVDGQIALASSIDIVSNEVGVRPRMGQDSWRTRLEQGILDTIAEVIAGARGSEGFWMGFTGPENPASLLYESKRLGVEWTTLQGDAALDGKGEAHDSDAMARVSSALQNGLAVVASVEGFSPGDESLSSWWEIDPANGQTLGKGPHGWGVDTTGNLVVRTVQGGLTYASAKTVRASIFCLFAAATAQVLAIGLAVNATIQMPLIGGVIVTLGGAQLMQVFPIVFQRCLEVMLFRAP